MCLAAELEACSFISKLVAGSDPFHVVGFMFTQNPLLLLCCRCGWPFSRILLIAAVWFLLIILTFFPSFFFFFFSSLFALSSGFTVRQN